MRMIMILCLVATAGMAQAKRPLVEVSEITDALLWVGIADEIRNTCPSISARMIRAWGRINDIQADAKARGYSDAEIKEFRTSDANKALLRKRGNAYLRANGVIRGEPETYCALGRAEIEKSSQIGTLLRTN